MNDSSFCSDSHIFKTWGHIILSGDFKEILSDVYESVVCSDAFSKCHHRCGVNIAKLLLL